MVDTARQLSHLLVFCSSSIMVLVFWCVSSPDTQASWCSCGLCIQRFKFFNFLSGTSWKRAKIKKKISGQNHSGCSAKLHLPACNSGRSKGIFEKAKGLLMNRLFIDLWTKQSLIMCRAAFNWGSRASTLLAERLRGQEWRVFDWVLCRHGDGWSTIT